MKARLFFDKERPKVDPDQLRKAVEAAGLDVVGKKADIGIVVGGDGIFSQYGKTESEPLLFVGVKSNKVTGSKAYMAEAYYDELGSALARVKTGTYSVLECPRLEVLKNGKTLGEVFTDVYLERGDESNSLRYKVKVTGPETSIEESAIGDGVVVTTAAGSRGYYSYPDRARGDRLEVDSYTRIPDGQIGVCHIAPTFVERAGSQERLLRYHVPWSAKVEIWTTRPANARLYGVDGGREGVKVTTKDRISVKAGTSSTRVIYFTPQ